MSPADRKLYGKGGLLAQEAVDRALGKLEREEHKIVMSWCKRNGLKCIHAGTHRKVHDLEPGWPDFSLIYENQVFLAEMKVGSNTLSEDQKRVMKELALNRTIVTVTGSAAETISKMRLWLKSSFGWEPSGE